MMGNSSVVQLTELACSKTRQVFFKYRLLLYYREAINSKDYVGYFSERHLEIQKSLLHQWKSKSNMVQFG